MTYFLVAFYLLLLSYVYDLKLYKKNFKIHYYISLVILILIAGLRYRMAPDSIVYLNDYLYRTDKLFDLRLENFALSRYQPFWILLNSLCKQFSNDFVTMQLVTATILNGVIFYFFRMSTSKVFTCVFFYYVTSYLYFNMEIMRESLAVAMFLLSFMMYNNKKYVKCFIFFIFAVLFHVYAILLGFIYLFISEFVSRKLKIFVSIILLVLAIAIPDPLLLLGNILGGTAKSSIAEYADVKLGTISITGYIYMFLRVYVVFYGIQKVKKMDHLPFVSLNKNMLINFGILYIVLVIIRAVSIPFLERLLNYFSIIIILFLTSVLFNYIRKFRFKNLKGEVYLGLLFMICIFNIYPMFKFVEEWNSPFYRRYFPYNSVFTKENNVEREYINYVESKEY